MSRTQDHALYSTSPSKPSLHNQHTHSRGLFPPNFEGHNFTPSNEDVVEESTLFDESDFRPFFALIENPSTLEHHHPTVHYIFADDDAEIIAEAACRALAQDDCQHIAAEDEENKLPPPIGKIREHYILLDVQASDTEGGYDVSKAYSLSSEWQVTNASISNAPTIDTADTDSGEGLMLKVEGIGAMTQKESEEVGRRKKESLQQMVERFERGFAEIKKIVDEGQHS